MSTNSTRSMFGLNLQLPNFGNGFVELTMLTTLVGRESAETMILGNHGAAGIAWATMSAFGNGQVARSCLSGACMPWLREMMGLRSKIVDSSLGMELSSNTNHSMANIIRSRYAAEGPLAITVDSSREQTGGKLIWKEIYAFDDSTSRLIKNAGASIAAYKEFSLDPKAPLVSSSSSIRSDKSFSSSTDTIAGEGINLSIYTYAPYDCYRQHHMKFQLFMLGLSFLKIGECLALWWLSGRPFLSLTTALPWLYFVVVAIIVEASDLSETRMPQDPDSHIDMLAGHLPKMTHVGAGGERKVILGISQNRRIAAWWKIMWGIGVLVCVPTIIFTYVVLSLESNQVLLLWMSFQLLWTFVHVIVYHFAEPMNHSVERILAERSWSTLPSPLKHRVVKLMSALASYLTSVHPRREISYRTAAVSPEDLRAIVFHSSLKSYYPLHQDIDSFATRKRKLMEVNISAVIGDPVLSSAAWIAGAQHLTPTDLYDCCIISFRIYTSKLDPLPKLMTVPCARVLSGIPTFSGIIPQIDEEVTHLPGPRQFVPKHVTNSGGSWCYFIPCEKGLWLFFRQNITLDVVGKHTAETLTDMQLTGMLAEGDMNISLSHVDDVKQIVRLSERANQILVQMLAL